MRNFGHAFSFTLYNIRSRFFHTFLSILGIVIGVASLVVVLALIDGMEETVRTQVLESTSLNIVMVSSEPFHKKDGIRMRKDAPAIWTPERFDALRKDLTIPATSQMITSFGAEVTVDTARVGAEIQYSTEEMLRPDSLLAGRHILASDVQNKDSVAVINRFLAGKIESDSTQYASLLGKSIVIRHGRYAIIGVSHSERENASVVLPITLMEPQKGSEYPPIAFLEAKTLEDVVPLQEEVRLWLRKNPASPTDSFSVVSNQFRVEQIAKGFILFRVVMGFIVGISVLVGGIGIMNVLLISMAQRKVEIGIRKSVGARKRDIRTQFLSESVVISCLGSFLGLTLGYLMAIGIAATIHAITDAPFQAAFRFGTLITVSVIAIVVGIVFGTYPATLAAKLSPAEAIRQET